jgi:hypothetical protein
MTGWACAVCGTLRLDPESPWCHHCHDNTLSVKTEPPITQAQYVAICRLFTSMGEVHRASRMRYLTRAAGRPISDYWELTASEADTIRAALEEEARAK